MVKCSSDAAYLKTGNAQIKIDAPEASSLHAMLLVKDAEASTSSGNTVMALLSTARYAMPNAAVTTIAEPAAAADVDEVRAMPVAAPVLLRGEARLLSSEVTTTSTDNTNSTGGQKYNSDGVPCGGDGQAACESAADKATDTKVENAEANFAGLIAFIGVIAIVRASNSYARQ